MTAAGNTLINYLVIEYTCRKFNIDAVAIVEGDDGIIATNDLILADYVRSTATALGLDLVMEVKESIEEIEFCKHWFIEDSATGTFYGCRALQSSLVKLGWDEKYQGKPGTKKFEQAIAARLNSLDSEYA